jgi:hypothetical protein
VEPLLYQNGLLAAGSEICCQAKFAGLAESLGDQVNQTLSRLVTCCMDYNGVGSVEHDCTEQGIWLAW